MSAYPNRTVPYVVTTTCRRRRLAPNISNSRNLKLSTASTQGAVVLQYMITGLVKIWNSTRSENWIGRENEALTGHAASRPAIHTLHSGKEPKDVARFRGIFSLITPPPLPLHQTRPGRLMMSCHYVEGLPQIELSDSEASHTNDSHHLQRRLLPDGSKANIKRWR